MVMCTLSAGFMAILRLVTNKQYIDLLYDLEPLSDHGDQGLPW